MTYLTKSEFAARRGWSKSYVSKLASQDRLVLTVDGKVDVEATEALLAESADPSKAAVAARHEENRVERDVRSHLQPGGDTPAVQPPVQPPGKGLISRKPGRIASTTLRSSPRLSSTRSRATWSSARRWRMPPSLLAARSGT